MSNEWDLISEFQNLTTSEEEMVKSYEIEEPDYIKVMRSGTRIDGVIDVNQDYKDASREYNKFRQGKIYRPLHFLQVSMLPGEMMLLAAPQGTGKTTVTQQAMCEAVKQGKKVLFVTTEVAVHNQLEKLEVAQAAVDKIVHSTTEPGKVLTVEWCDVKTQPTYDKICDRLQDLNKAEYRRTGSGFDVIIFDQLNNCMNASPGDRLSSQDRFSYITKSFIGWLAEKSIHVPVIIMLQQKWATKVGQKNETQSKMGGESASLLKGCTRSYDDASSVVMISSVDGNRTFTICKTREKWHGKENTTVTPQWLDGVYTYPVDPGEIIKNAGK